MFRMKFVLLMAVALLATVVVHAQESLDAESFKDKDGTTTKPPTVVKPPPVKRTTPPSEHRAPKNPTEKARKPGKDKPGKKCTRGFCNRSLNNIVDEIGHTFKLCSAQSCPRLRIFKNVMEGLGFQLSRIDQTNFNRATTPTTNCTANLAPICTRMQKRIRKSFTKAFESQCTNVTCPNLFKAQANLKASSPSIIVASIASADFPEASYLGCSGSYSMSPDVPTFAPVDSEGKDNLTFESCLDYCAGNNMPYMVIADQTQCNCYLNEQDIASGDHEPDGGFEGPYECNLPCFGDGDAVYNGGCGDFFEGNAAFYSLDYEFST